MSQHLKSLKRGARFLPLETNNTVMDNPLISPLTIEIAAHRLQGQSSEVRLFILSGENMKCMTALLTKGSVR